MEWYKNKAVWGGVVAAAAGILTMVGVPLGPEDTEAVTEVIVQVIGIIGALVAIYGRVKDRLDDDK